jgi:hypothetical protein
MDNNAHSAKSAIEKYFRSPIIAQYSDRFEMKKSRSANLEEAARQQRLSNTSTKRDTVVKRRPFVLTGQMTSPSNGVRFNVPESVSSAASSTASLSPSFDRTPSTDLTEPSPNLSDIEFSDIPTASFAGRTINLMIEDHPDLEAELNLLKKSMLHHEGELQNKRNSFEAEKHKVLYEADLKVEQFQIALRKKIDYINAAHQKLSEYEEALDEIESSKQDVKNLQEILKMKDKEIQVYRRNKISTVLQGEREKKELTDMIADLQQRLEAESIRANDQIHEKDEAMRNYEGMKNRLDTYLSYFERQGSQVRAYLFEDKKEIAGKVIEGSVDHGFGFKRLDAGKVVKLPSIIEEDESKDGEIAVSKFLSPEYHLFSKRHHKSSNIHTAGFFVLLHF